MLAGHIYDLLTFLNLQDTYLLSNLMLVMSTS